MASRFRQLVTLFHQIRANRAGFIGLLGLIGYFILTFLLPYVVPFDDQPKLDEITAPPGSRLQLAVHRDNAERFRTLEDLAGETVGVVSQTGGLLFLKEFAETTDTPPKAKRYRWRSRISGPGIEAALKDVANQKIAATLVYSQAWKEAVEQADDPAFQKLIQETVVISNPTLGPMSLLGTDTQGRDLASHIVHGGRVLILTALLGGILSTVLAVCLGSLAALFGGVVDQSLTAITNLFLAIPRFPLLVVLAGLISFENTLLLGVLIGLLGWPALMRAIRAQVLSLRERDFVEAARSLGLGTPHIMFREILPNMISFVAINLIFAITSAMYEQIGLVVLGLAPINDYTWGIMLFFGRTRGTLFNPDGISMALSPVLAIALFQVCLVLFARALEELFDPRLRGK